MNKVCWLCSLIRRSSSTLLVLISVSSIVIAGGAWCINYETLQRENLEDRRDVLRRIMGYSYRLTEGRTGQDGEPFIALNEASIVFAEHNEVIDALEILHRGVNKEEEQLVPNLVELIKAMIVASELPPHARDLPEKFLVKPFVPGVDPMEQVE